MGYHHRMTINTRERAVSGDINRAQAMLAAELRETLMAAVTAPGNYAKPAATNYAISSCVLYGLLVRPDAGTYLLVDGGAAVFFDPAFGSSPDNADDSDLVMGASVGVTSTTLLTFAANGLGSVRTDVIECRPVDSLISSESRDLYDPTTGMFTPAVVDKERAVLLEFRLRRGTPGLAVDAGWMPIAVAFVPPGATNYSECDFYDVRPLWSERVTSSDRSDGRAVKHLDVDCSSGGIAGSMWGSAFGYLAGGADPDESLGRNAPISSTAYFNDATDPTGGLLAWVAWTPDNVGAGFSPADRALMGCYAVFPALSTGGPALPRWQRYSQSAAPREPTGPRGILVWDAISRSTKDYLANAVQLPSSIASCLAPTAAGVVAGFGWYDLAGTAVLPTPGGGGTMAGPLAAGGVPLYTAATSISTGGGNITVIWDPPSWSGTVFPVFARGFSVELTFTRATDGSGPLSAYAGFQLEGYDGAADVIRLGGFSASIVTSSGSARPAYAGVYIPMQNGTVPTGVRAAAPAANVTNWTPGTTGEHPMSLVSVRYW
jgi:hypothetical protein